MTDWISALQLDSARAVTAGSEAALCDAVRRGADLRIYTEFRHIDLDSPNDEAVREVGRRHHDLAPAGRYPRRFRTEAVHVDLPV